MPPNDGALFTDEARIVKDGQAQGFAVGAVHRKHLRVVIPRAERKKNALPIGILRIDGGQDGKRAFQGEWNALSDSDALAGIVENGRANDALRVQKPPESIGPR